MARWGEARMGSRDEEEESWVFGKVGVLQIQSKGLLNKKGGGLVIREVWRFQKTPASNKKDCFFASQTVR